MAPGTPGPCRGKAFGGTACGAYSHKRWDKLGRRCQPLSVSATRVPHGWHPASGLRHLPLQILGPLE
eukprot:3477150-Amphidinium_carterae.1